MGKGVVYCTRCGERLLEEEFQKNRAFILLNKYACYKCKDILIASFTPKERAKLEQHSGTSTKVIPPTTRSTRKLMATQRSMRKLKKFPVIPVAIGGGVAVVLILLIVALSSGGTPRQDTSADTAREDAYRKKTEVAAKLVGGLRKYIEEHKGDVDAVLGQVDGVKDKISGTDSEGALSEIQSAFVNLRERRDLARKTIAGYLEAAKEKSANNTNFDYHAEISELFQKAVLVATTEIKKDLWVVWLKEEQQKVEVEQGRYMAAYKRSAEAAFNALLVKINAEVANKQYQRAVELGGEYPTVFRDTEWQKQIAAAIDEIQKRYLKVGQWQTLFNGTSMKGWTRLPGKGKELRDNNWKLEGTVLVGTSSFPKDEPGVPWSDCLYFEEDFADYEVQVTWTGEGDGLNAQGKSIGLGFLFRCLLEGDHLAAAGGIVIATKGQRRTAILHLQGNAGYISVDNERVQDIVVQKPQPTGKFALVLFPGVKARVEKIQIKRLK